MARNVTATTLTMSLAVVPTFLVSGLAVLLRDDLDFGEAQLGLAISAFSISAAVFSIPSGRLSDLVGAYRGMMAALVLASLALLGIGAFATSWLHVAAFLAVGGIAQAFAASSTNLALVRGLPPGYQGLGFGIKTASIPVAAMAAGLALPLIGLTLGWRTAFLGTLAVVVATMFVVPRDEALSAPPARERTGPRRHTGIDGDLRPLATMTFAAAFGSGTGSAMLAFWVVSAVDRGISPGRAGLWLATGSIVGIAGRISWGRMVDRTGRLPLNTCAVLLITGSIGLFIVALTTHPVLLVLATLLVFGCGWAWTGLFHLAVVRHHPATPAAATGFTQLGLRGGGIIGPAGFGLLAQHGSYTLAWLCAAACMCTSGLLMSWARRTLTRSETATATP